MTEESSGTKRIYCNWCRRETNHNLKGAHEQIFVKHDNPFTDNRRSVRNLLNQK